MLPQQPSCSRIQLQKNGFRAYSRARVPQIPLRIQAPSQRAAARPSTAAAASKRPPLTSQEVELLKQIENYRYEVATPEGQLIVNVLRSDLIPRAADLLTDTFVDTKGIQPYRRYVRRNIYTYLEQHSDMSPSAVLLTAMLQTQVPADDSDSLMLESLHEPQTTPGSHRSSNSGAATSSNVQQQHFSSSSSSLSTQDGIGGVVLSALQQLSSGLGLQQQQQQMKTVEHLVGVAEVSFRAFTRSSHFTLNPPKKCAYLCNMAVAAEWRRRGIASHLITAVEDLCLLAGEADMYLHLRMKDSNSAGGLYRKTGFRIHQKDWPIIILLGQEPRYLMNKQLPESRQLVGLVRIPQEQQGMGRPGDGMLVKQGAGMRQVAPAVSPAA